MTPAPPLLDRLTDVLDVIREGAVRVDRDAVFPREQIDALGSAGLLGLAVPAEHGGLGASPADAVDVLWRVAGACGSTAMVLLMHTAASAVITAAPPADGADELLAALASGDALGTLAFSERGSRSHFWAPVSTAVAGPAGTVRIQADKSWVTSAHIADVYVASTLAPGAASSFESELYVVRRDRAGVDVLGAFDGVGLRGNDSAPVRLDVEVPVGARLGGPQSGFASMMQTVLPWFSVGNAAVSLGLAASALDTAIAHVSGSRFDHLSSTLADLPTIRAYLAKSWADLRAHDAMLRACAASLASPDEGTMLLVLATKAACNEAALRITDTAMRVAGGAAFSRQVGIERLARDARAGFVMAPTSDALFDFAGRALCGLELF